MAAGLDPFPREPSYVATGGNTPSYGRGQDKSRRLDRARASASSAPQLSRRAFTGSASHARRLVNAGRQKNGLRTSEADSNGWLRLSFGFQTESFRQCRSAVARCCRSRGAGRARVSRVTVAHSRRWFHPASGEPAVQSRVRRRFPEARRRASGRRLPTRRLEATRRSAGPSRALTAVGPPL